MAINYSWYNLFTGSELVNKLSQIWFTSAVPLKSSPQLTTMLRNSGPWSRSRHTRYAAYLSQRGLSRLDRWLLCHCYRYQNGPELVSAKTFRRHQLELQALESTVYARWWWPTRDTQDLLSAIESFSRSETDNTGSEELDKKLEEVKSQNIHMNINGKIKDNTDINNKLILSWMNIYRERCQTSTNEQWYKICKCGIFGWHWL